jgi:hypothetical protein
MSGGSIVSCTCTLWRHSDEDEISKCACTVFWDHDRPHSGPTDSWLYETEGHYREHQSTPLYPEPDKSNSFPCSATLYQSCEPTACGPRRRLTWLLASPLYRHRESAPNFVSTLLSFQNWTHKIKACVSQRSAAKRSRAVWRPAGDKLCDRAQCPDPCDPRAVANCCSPMHSSVGKGHWSSLRPILRSWYAWLGTWLCCGQWRAANCNCDSCFC